MIYNKKIIIPAILLGLLVILSPFVSSFLGTKKAMKPLLEKATNGKQCVLPVKKMRKEHMSLLVQWRDDVVRKGNRSTVKINGKEYKKSLTETCLQCHVNKKNFCDRCHDYSAVKPKCWSCHISKGAKK